MSMNKFCTISQSVMYKAGVFGCGDTREREREKEQPLRTTRDICEEMCERHEKNFFF